jgi:transcriptional regulator with XRE-family HTH domain
MAADVPLGEQVRAARERRHLTQQQLADLLGVDRKTVDNWENHRTSPRNRMGALVAWAPELGGDESDAERDKAMLHDSIDRMDVRDLAKMVEAYRKLQRNGAAPRRERAG